MRERLRTFYGTQLFVTIYTLSTLTTLTPTISPLAFLTFFNCLKKYQNRDLATTVLGAKILMR